MLRIRRLLVLSLVFAFRGTVLGDPPPAGPAPAKAVGRPSSPAQAADAVLAALKANDAAAVKAVAEKEDPDAWMVADELIGREELPAAEALAKAATGANVAALPAYVAARVGRPADPALAEARKGYLASAREKDPAKALALIQPAKTIGPEVILIRASGRLGNILQALDRAEEAAAVLTAGGEAAQRLGWLRAASALLQQGAAAAYLRADWKGALATWEKRLAVEEAWGNRAGAAATLSNFGIVYWSLGDFAKALSYVERGRKVFEEMGRDDLVARAWLNIGTNQRAMGDYARARASAEKAQAIFDRIGEKRGGGIASMNLGVVLTHLGDSEAARAAYEKAMRTFEEIGDRASLGRVVTNLAIEHMHESNWTLARKEFERSLALFEAIDDRIGVADATLNIGMLLAKTGDGKGSLDACERALARYEGLGSREGLVYAIIHRGIARRALGDSNAALADLDRGAREAERIRSAPLLVAALEEAAWTRMERKEPEAAWALARRAAPYVDVMVKGEDEEHGAAARAQHAGLFAAGAAAAADLGRPAEVAYFLDGGRAGTLLESLTNREVLLSASLPENLRAAESASRAIEASALARYRSVSDAGVLDTVRSARVALDAAREKRAAVIEEIQRTERASANVFYPKAATLEEMQAWLKDREDLVFYGFVREKALALVVTRKTARIVKLGATADVEAACASLAGGKPEAYTVAAIDGLRARIATPLGLDDDARRLIVCPEGALSYVPFSVLFPGREVAYVPSGTALGWLLEERSPPGAGVLALADPDYATGRGTKTPPLPASRVEAKEVADVALYGGDSTEVRLRREVALRPRWRAVHFACHGVFSPERPMLSALALTPSGDDDGFLTVLDVFQSRIPTDLVVLSACETAKGKVVRGEGIVGLTRAFMFAGAPRVLCSLWKVDDDATRALMVKFYSLWNPKDGSKAMGTAAALRAAQEFVRSHEIEVPDDDATKRTGKPVKKRVRPWENAYYWAAWALWGLPE